MTITLHAQPYDISATGFYFKSAKDYRKKAKAIKNAYGDLVEEFEIQFIDGERIDCELAKAIGLSQANFADFLECAEAWEDWQKINVIIATGEWLCCTNRGLSAFPLSLDGFTLRALRWVCQERCSG